MLTLNGTSLIDAHRLMWGPGKIVCRFFLICLTVAVLDWHALAQYIGHAVEAPQDTSGMAAKTETRPADDAVLTQAPQVLQLGFPQRVRLVKLTLRTDQQKRIDIRFRYDPTPNQLFIWRLPNLEASAYYVADWAALTPDERLVRGSFGFAFGPDAKAPSVILRQQASELQPQGGSQNSRYVSPPPAQIILDRDPPSYDPPFTIDLGNNAPD